MTRPARTPHGGQRATEASRHALVGGSVPPSVARDDATLCEAIAHAMRLEQSTIRLSGRTTNAWASSHHSELVRCRLGGGQELRLFVKVERHDRRAQRMHWNGLATEAVVYRDVLSKLPVSAPTFYGSFTDSSGATWLILSDLGDFVRLSEAAYPDGLTAAARWLGSFHSSLTTFDSRYYESLSTFDAAHVGDAFHRAAVELHARSIDAPWLRQALADHLAAVLLSGAPSLIHGEFYPHNVVLKTGAAYPIDWESAAVGPPEIDFAALTDGWGRDAERVARAGYAAGQRGGPRVVMHPERVLAARLYLHIRWLGWPKTYRTERAWRLGEAIRLVDALGQR